MLDSNKVELNFLDTSIKKLDNKKSLPKIVVPLALYPLHLRRGKNLISGEFLWFRGYRWPLQGRSTVIWSTSRLV